MQHITGNPSGGGLSIRERAELLKTANEKKEKEPGLVLYFLIDVQTAVYFTILTLLCYSF